MSNKKANGSAKPEQMPLTIRAQYIKDLSFENPNPLSAFIAEDESQPSISVDIQVRGQDLGEKTYEVILDARINANRGNNVLFVIELSYAGIASVGDFSEEDTQKIIMVQTPQMLFPFARNIIADMTRESGYPPLLLSPIDFEALFIERGQEELKAKEKNLNVS